MTTERYNKFLDAVDTVCCECIRFNKCDSCPVAYTLESIRAHKEIEKYNSEHKTEKGEK